MLSSNIVMVCVWEGEGQVRRFLNIDTYVYEVFNRFITQAHCLVPTSNVSPKHGCTQYRCAMSASSRFFLGGLELCPVLPAGKVCCICGAG